MKTVPTAKTEKTRSRQNRTDHFQHDKYEFMSNVVICCTAEPSHIWIVCSILISNARRMQNQWIQLWQRLREFLPRRLKEQHSENCGLHHQNVFFTAEHTEQCPNHAFIYGFPSLVYEPVEYFDRDNNTHNLNPKI